MRRRSAYPALLALLAVVAVAGIYATFAVAIDTTTVFQLDGNTADTNGASAPDDWDTLAAGGGSSKSFSGIIADGTGDTDTGYGSGLTKDTYDVPNWTWVTGTVTPGKSNIAHAYAAAYADGQLYFGQDKPASSGVNAVGFWFFQNKVGLGAGTTGGNFVGTHKEGDLLITSDFTNGGNTSIINIFKWESGALVLKKTSSTAGVECGASSGSEVACMVSNKTSTFTAQWPPYPPGYAIDEFSFVEGGIDLNEFYGGAENVPCFSNFLADTRTSASASADLKDFTLGNVDTCGKVELRKVWVGAAGNVDLKIASGQTTIASGSANGGNGSTGETTVKPGTYGFSETQGANTNLAADYTSTYACVDESGKAQNLPSGSYSGSFDVTVDTGQDIVCTITNARKPQLRVDKVLVPSDDLGKFNLQIDGQTSGTGANVGNGGTTGLQTVVPGAHTVGETQGTATSLSDYDPAISCSVNGGTPTNGASVTLQSGQTGVCTITNTRKPTLKLVKSVTNNNGGSATAGQWSLSASAAGPNSGRNFSNAGNAGVFNAVFAGVAYTLSESGGPSGYTAGAWDCPGVTVADDKVTLTAGQNITCTITNDDKVPSLTLDKIVVNDNGGTASESAWTLTANGGAAGTLSGPGAAGAADVVSGVSFKAGTYALSESTGPAGYSPSSWSCVKNAGAPAEVTSITLGLGDTAVCTITNDDKVPSLTLDKIVVNDNGGTASESAWTLTANGGAAGTLSGPGAAGAADVVSGVSFKAGTYALSESTGPAGYSPSSWSCVKNAGAPAEVTSITLGLGDTAVCTITNDDKVPSLTLDKIVVNDNGGTASESAWTLTANGGAAGTLSGPGAAGAADVVSGVSFKAGTYALSESTGPAGYSPSSWSCVKNAGAPAEVTSITLGLGDTAVCTITNDDVAGTIIVKKVVINDEGGTKTAGDFTFKVGSAAPVAFVEDPQNPLKGEKPVSVAAGTYTITEPAVAGYDASYENCSDIVVGNGETKTCTITNNDNIPPTVDVQKTVRVAGSADAFAETATAPETSGTFEYRVVAWNTSKEAVTLTALTDKIGDVETNLDGKGTCSVPQSLEASDGTSGGADTYSCTFELTLTGNAGDAQKDTVKATVKDDENDTASAEDDANVSLTDVASSIEVTKTADPETLDESTVGSAVEYTVVVKNTSAVDKVTVDAAGFVDKVKVNGDPTAGDVATITNLDCNPQDNEDDGLPFTLDPTESITCTFSMSVKGNAGDHVNDLITVTGKDDDGNDVSDSDDATVTITDVPSTITVTKTANPTVVQDSGPVTFTVVVRNDSDVDTVYIQTLTDSIYGNLNGKGTCTLEDAIDEGPEGSRRILPGASYTCSFTATVSKTETDVVTATGVDDDEQPVSDDDDATVTVNRTPPPPYKPSSDIAVTKAATPQVQLPLGGGTAPITYNLVVINNGPDAAANVKVADTAPVNVSFVSATTSAGTCSTTAQALDCTIASLAPGASVAITINATVNATGTKVNMVLVTTTTPETNPNNNSAQARTLVTAPVTPPKPPKPPIVVPAICNTLVATPKVLKATGKKQKINITVKQGKKGVKGVKVKIAGPGIKRTVTTGKKGNVKVTLKPGKPGIIKVVILPKKKVNGKWVKVKACNTQRIGVVGVYEPPVTG